MYQTRTCSGHGPARSIPEVRKPSIPQRIERILDCTCGSSYYFYVDDVENYETTIFCCGDNFFSGCSKRWKIKNGIPTFEGYICYECEHFTKEVYKIGNQSRAHVYCKKCVKAKILNHSFLTLQLLSPFENLIEELIEDFEVKGE